MFSDNFTTKLGTMKHPYIQKIKSECTEEVSLNLTLFSIFSRDFSKSDASHIIKSPNSALNQFLQTGGEIDRSS